MRTPYFQTLLMALLALAVAGLTDAALHGEVNDEAPEPSPISFYVAVNASDPAVENLDEVIATFESTDERQAEHDHIKWLPIADPEMWLRQIPVDAIDMDDPDWVAAMFAQTRRLIVRQSKDEYFMLVHTAPPGVNDEWVDEPWGIERVEQEEDGIGRPAIGMTLDKASADRMRRLSRASVGRAMAIVVNGVVYTAPTLQSEIGARMQMTGEFSDETRTELIHLLRGERPSDSEE